jgi:hypothetical protein
VCDGVGSNARDATASGLLPRSQADAAMRIWGSGIGNAGKWFTPPV